MSTGIGSAERPRPDGAHLDEDAECLEDPVHCGDARHQHDAHVTPPVPPVPTAAATTAATGETPQT